MTMAYYQNELKFMVDNRIFKLKNQEDSLEQHNLLFKLNEKIEKSGIQMGTLIIEITVASNGVLPQFMFKRSSTNSIQGLNGIQHTFMVHNKEIQIPGMDSGTQFFVDINGCHEVAVYIQIVGSISTAK